MHAFALVTSFAALAVAQASAEYRLQTEVKPSSQVGNWKQLDQLYLEPYHTGAGLNDVVFTSTNASTGAIGFLQNSSQIFNVEGGYPYNLVIDEVRRKCAVSYPMTLS